MTSRLYRKPPPGVDPSHHQRLLGNAAKRWGERLAVVDHVTVEPVGKEYVVRHEDGRYFRANFKGGRMAVTEEGVLNDVAG